MQDVFGHFTTILEEDFPRLPKIPEDFQIFPKTLE